MLMVRVIELYLYVSLDLRISHLVLPDLVDSLPEDKLLIK